MVLEVLLLDEALGAEEAKHAAVLALASRGTRAEEGMRRRGGAEMVSDGTGDEARRIVSVKGELREPRKLRTWGEGEGEGEGEG